jgi:hypothetical protein
MADVAALWEVGTTWAKAIKNGNFITWSEINNISLAEHLPPSIASVKGRLDQTQKFTDDINFFPPPPEPNVKSFDCLCHRHSVCLPRPAYHHDLIGRFPTHHHVAINTSLRFMITTVLPFFVVP